ncbi:unnamed protein product [Cuscuta campestris]|uniref:Uncharacterized protein n=1 Tax=Cuscuta campestris TaxID=132261 RepID=A0A484MWR9_9ASTE|nr:unnamed protein product [Cuscuta campestris]
MTLKPWRNEDAMRGFRRKVVCRKKEVPFIMMATIIIIYLSFSTPLLLEVEACHPVDQEALLDLKNSITEDPQKMVQNWTPSTDCCIQWEGITCDNQTGRVSEMDLRDRQNLSGSIPGSIPDSIGRLEKLRLLALGGNRFSGRIPSYIGNLQELRVLWLYSNSLSGPIPPSITNLTSLEQLDFENNTLTGTIPLAIGHLKKLTTLSLGTNNLTGNLPESIGRLSSLISLALSNNHFTGEIPETFANLRNLTNMELSRNQLSGKIPPKLGSMPSLVYLDLSFNPSLNLQAIPEWISSMKVGSLFLAGTGIKGELPNWLASSSLTRLDLSNNGMTGKIPSWIDEFKYLSRLMDLDLHSNNLSGDTNNIFNKSCGTIFGVYYSIDLSDNQFSGGLGEIVDGLYCALNALQSLRLSNNQIEGRIPKALGNATILETIVLSGNKFNGTIPEEVMNLESLKEFDVSRNRLSGEIPAHKANIPKEAFLGNPGLCGSPLPPCTL